MKERWQIDAFGPSGPSRHTTYCRLEIARRQSAALARVPAKGRLGVAALLAWDAPAPNYEPLNRPQVAEMFTIQTPHLVPLGSLFDAIEADWAAHCLFGARPFNRQLILRPLAAAVEHDDETAQVQIGCSGVGDRWRMDGNGPSPGTILRIEGSTWTLLVMALDTPPHVFDFEAWQAETAALRAGGLG